METIKILVVGKHPEIMKTILRLINTRPEWEAEAAFSTQQVNDMCTLSQYALVLLGAGLDVAETEQIQQYLKTYQPLVKFAQHYGGGSGLLYAEIYQALG